MTRVDYEGKTYELVEVERDVYSCKHCAMWNMPCAESDPEALCFMPASDRDHVMIFKEVTEG